MDMNLRPHHLLCIQKFTGHGYDEAFTKHMTEIVTRLAENPETRVKLIHGCDFVCTKCPNNENETCVTAEKVLKMDEGVLEVCGLTYGETVAWAELSRRAREGVFESEKFERICGTCQWYELCKNTEVSR